MADINKLLGGLMGSGAAGGFAGGLAGGLASGLLTSKSGRKMGKQALKLGGVAAVGALAYSAYQKYSDKSGAAASGQAQPDVTYRPQPAQQAAHATYSPANSAGHTGTLTQAPAGSAFMPAANDIAAQEALGLTLIRAMIAAARSDGRLDAQESQAIFQRIEALGLDADTQRVLVQEMGHPVDMDAIVASATCPEVAAEIYAASLLAIEVDSAAERAYLSMLAARLNLPQGLVNEIEAQMAQ
ncbi:tellurite resistance TerB family protein [Aliagarivorans taiwanensis]|uniref:tellurite resistance TerB family protein n=1 Tax=Aliagarivorans taiwanensis TaxID=561966 RepID=UPI0004170F36|nr:tellurite resistance TerB family protein [Aliagarivorans taiwanensis]